MGKCTEKEAIISPYSFSDQTFSRLNILFLLFLFCFFFTLWTETIMVYHLCMVLCLSVPSFVFL